jgi:hypothetical protein
MALVDPNIAMSYRGIEVPNQLAQYGQVQQIQNAQNQNRLADLQYRAAEIALQKQRALQDYRAQNDPSSPNYYSGLRRIDSGVALEEEAQQATISKTRTETEAKQFENENKRLDFTLQAIGSSPTPERAIYYINKGLRDGVFSMQEASGELAKLQNMPPEEFARYRMGQLQRTLAAKDQMEILAPQIDFQDVGGSLVGLQGNRYQPGYGQPVSGLPQIRKTPTIGERTAQGNLTLAQQKFEFEKANPGITVQMTEDGTLVGINNRTGQAMPITMGGGAPAAPTGGGGMPAAPMPATTPAAVPTPAAVTTPAAGTPLRGKGTAMTDTQHNAAMFGGAMAQAQNTIQQIERSGTNKSVALVPGLLTGLVNMAPFGAGEGFANAIEATFRADPTRFAGPDADQQRLAQAQLAFATAYLRKTSGAAFGPSEVANTIKEFFPLRGEPDAVVKQKAASRERVVKGMSLGTTAEGRRHIEEAAGSNDPLGIR